MTGEIVIRGKIISSQLATFSTKPSVYGYLIMREEDGGYDEVKVDLHTECESVLVGDMVEVHAEELGETGIIVARRISLIPGPFYSSTDESTEEATT